MNCKLLAFALIGSIQVVHMLGQSVDLNAPHDKVASGVSISSPAVRENSTSTTTDQIILKILKNENLSGTLMFTGSCKNFDYPQFPNLPIIENISPNSGKTMQLLHQAFRNAPAFSIKRQSRTNVSIIENTVPMDVMKIKINHLSFNLDNGTGIYSPVVAINRIIYSPEVQQYMKQNNIQWPYKGGYAIGVVSDPSVNEPHVSGIMEQTTVSSALNRIIETFPGLLIYENCPANEQRDRVIYFKIYTY